MKKVKCPSCNSESMVFYKEKVYVYETPLTIKGQISKKENLLYVDDNFSHIDCKNCGKAYNYKIDKNGNITDLISI